MAVLPFLFFLLLTIYFLVKHKGVSMCTFMSVQYTISSLCAFILVLINEVEGSGILWAGWNVEANFIPTVSYCLFIGLCIYPFALFDVRKIKIVSNNAPITLLCICILLIVTSVISFYCVADSTIEILGGDLKALRDAHYAGDQSPAEIKAGTLPFIAQFLLYFRRTTILCLPIAFYFICFTKAPKWWNALLVFASLTAPLNGIQSIDRTEIMYYSLMFLICILMFYRFMSKKFKIILSLCSLVMSILIGIYIIAISAARFEDTDSGTSVSMLQYGGQGYLNYCYFCENADFNQIATEREFPLFNKYVNKIESNPDRRDERSAKQGFFISVFASFIGDIILDLSPIGLTIWILGFVFIVILTIRRYGRSEYDISEFLILFIFAGVPVFGIFYYRYYNISDSYTFLFLAILYVMAHLRFRLNIANKTVNEKDYNDNSNI